MNLRAGLSFVFALALIGLSVPTQAAVTPTTSPLAPINRNGKSSTSQLVLGGKHAAHISRAAICTEDISQIKFSEYYVDWSTWMSEVGNRWSTVFNAAYNSGKFRTDGPAFVQFTCKRDGSISEIALARSSGDTMCDRGQIEALANCMPLPAFPMGSRKSTVTVMYVWEYGNKPHVAKQVQPQHRPARRVVPDVQRITISGKIM